MRPGIASRTTTESLSTYYEGAWTARKEFERGQTTEVFDTSIEAEKQREKSLKA